MFFNYIFKNKYYLRNISIGSLLLTLFTLSFPQSISLYSLGLLLFIGFILWLIFFNKNLGYLLKNWLIIIPPVLYFFLHFIEIVIFKEPFSIIIKRLIFVSVPILGLSILLINYDNNKLFKVFSSYIFGITIISLILLINFIIKLWKNKPDNINSLLWINQNYIQYTSTGFSIFEHPTYLSMKIIWAILLTVYFYYKKINKLLLLAIFAILSVTIFLLASKAGITMWIILMLSLLVFYIGRKISSKFLKYFTISVIAISLITVSFEITKEISRINVFINQISNGISQENIDWKNLDQRTREWYCAFQLIKEKPILGHGIGKVEDRMVEEYLKNGWVEEARLRLNAHNQFLETQMTFGIPGTLTLLWMLLTPLIFRKRLQYPELATAFVFMMTFFLMFESMFVRQWGIMFFTLFYCILVIPSKDKNSVQLNHSVLKNK